MNASGTYANPALQVIEGNKARWNHAGQRRAGFHSLHRIARYALGLRAARVLALEMRVAPRIVAFEALRQLTELPQFSAMVVVRGRNICFEQYAPDFGRDCPHSIQSITKTMMNLVVGKLVEQGVLDLSQTVAHYIPEIGSGYATATLQQVLNMDVVNDYSEDFADPQATYYRHEEAMGWRLPQDAGREQTQRKFLLQIGSTGTTNHSNQTHYKDANTDVLGWVVERASGRPLRSFLADIADAAGLEGMLHMTTDREGVPALDGGACLTARDLARYMSIFARRGDGVDGRPIGSAWFIDRSLNSGVPMPPPNETIRYSNHLMVRDALLGHGGWCGQYAMVNMQTRAVGVFLSVVEDEHAATPEYKRSVHQMLEAVTGPQFHGSES